MTIKRIVLIMMVCSLWSVVSLPAFAQSIAWDPAGDILNGRILGLGKASSGLADDLATNPAGLAEVGHWQASSLSGRYLDEYNYLALSGLYPTDYGTVGLGFAGSAAGGAYQSRIKAGSDPAEPIYELDQSLEPAGSYNNVLLLSWGSLADKFIPQPFLKGVAVGARLKYFMAGLSGAGITGGRGDAAGRELDLGIQYQPPERWLKFGLALRNLLSAAQGGKLTYNTGHEETYPAVVEGGVALNFNDGKQELLALLDLVYPSALLRAGLEYRPHPMLALRAGFGQDPSFGLGLFFDGFRLDYALRQEQTAPGMGSSYLSLTYGVFPPEPEIEFKGPPLMAADKLVTLSSSVTIEGKALHPKIADVRIRGVKAYLSPQGDFRLVVPVDLGPNSFTIEGYDRVGNLLGRAKARVLRLVTYPDVSREAWAAGPIGYIATLKIVTGYPNGKFRPEGNITRAELGTVLKRLGYRVKLSRPKDKVTRAEGLTMVCRFSGISEEAYLNQFPDVAVGFWAAKTIAGAYRAGMLDHFLGKPFNPKRILTRAEAVDLLYRSPRIKKLLGEGLLNWEAY